MKKIIQFSFLIVAFSLSQAQISFQKDNFQTLLQKAKKENKLIFLDAYASWCGPCKMMDKNIFTQKSVGDYYNTTFVNAKIDMEKGEGVDLAKKYGVRAYPTYLFINGNGEIVNRAVGYFEIDKFLKLGKDAVNPQNSVAVMRKKFDAGEDNPQFLKDLIAQNYMNDFDFAKKVSERYFSKSNSENLTKEDLGMLMFFIKSTEDFNYKYFINNKANIIKILPEDKYTQFDNQTKLNGIVQNAIDKEKKTINEEYFLTEASKIVGADEAQKALQKLKLAYYMKEKKYDEYGKTALQYYKDATKFDATELNSVAWNFFLHIKDRESLQTAINWANESIKKNHQSFNTDTLANLYQKIGDKENAIKWATTSIELAKKSGEDYSETQKIIDSYKAK